MDYFKNLSACKCDCQTLDRLEILYSIPSICRHWSRAPGTRRGRCSCKDAPHPPPPCVHLHEQNRGGPSHITKPPQRWNALSASNNIPNTPVQLCFHKIDRWVLNTVPTHAGKVWQSPVAPQPSTATSNLLPVMLKSKNIPPPARHEKVCNFH